MKEKLTLFRNDEVRNILHSTNKKKLTERDVRKLKSLLDELKYIHLQIMEAEIVIQHRLVRFERAVKKIPVSKEEGVVTAIEEIKDAVKWARFDRDTASEQQAETELDETIKRAEESRAL